MAAEDTHALISLYESRYRDQGADITTLGWKNREEQALRFKMLADIACLHGASICDVGCGFGDLLGYFQQQGLDGVSARYTGLDIVPALLAEARALHPGVSFEQVDLDEQDYVQEHDFFLSSGALSFKRRDNMAHAERMISRMFALSRRGLAVNFLSTYVNHQHPRNFHYSPEDMFRLARRYTRWVKVRHDYPLWEFTLYMYKEAQP